MYLGKSFESYLESTGEIGFVEMMEPPLVKISGLPRAFIGEAVIFEDNSLGMIFSLDEDFAQILLLGKGDLEVGSRVSRTGLTLKTRVDESFLGGAFSSLGEDLYGNFRSLENSALVDIFSEAPDFSERAFIESPLETGVSIVDLLVPLGKGQRELVIGDRKSGKTEFLLQTILSQARQGSVCIYCSIGKNRSDILNILEFFQKMKIEEKCLLVGSSSSDTPGEIYLTPYTAMAFAEYFRDQGHDVLLILDDLSTHAGFYRELSLIGGSFPGRGSYPGDMFFTHSQLLERAGNFKCGENSHSITCMPVADTIEGDISGYIQTNLMSMTDGHIFFDEFLFDSGHRPAVNTFLSVTRVGRQVQTKLHKSLNRELTGFMNLRRKHEKFIHFGAELSEGIKTSLETGAKLDAFFNQQPRFVYPLKIQYLLFTLLWGGFITGKQVDSLRFLGEKMVDSYQNDSDFRSYIDNIFQENMDFNDLLAVVSREQASIKEVLGMK